MTQFWADPERLRAVSPQFAQLGADVEAALEKLRTGIESEGKCWGGDEPGQQFEQQYPQNGPGSVGETLTALANLAGRVKATGDKITGTANTAEGQDQASAEQVRRV